MTARSQHAAVEIRDQLEELAADGWDLVEDDERDLRILLGLPCPRCGLGETSIGLGFCACWWTADGRPRRTLRAGGDAEAFAASVGDVATRRRS